MGFKLEQCCPIGYEIDNINSHTNIDEAVIGKDIICTDSIPSKAKEDFKEYQIALQHMGRPLYEKYGFIKMEDEMELV